MQPQTQLNQYVFLEKLGDGGMGEVWKAKHSYLEYEVAIKFLKPQFAEDKELQERFLNEGKRLARLDHPNIVRAIDFLTDANGRHYLVMKYIDGTGLDKKIEAAHGPLHFAETLKTSLRVLAALDYAHSRGVIHRDVKPSNILVDADGEAYLTDFGIALAVGGLRMTRTGSVIGTTYYMSPEQIQTPHDVDPSTDIYSFGVVLFEMLTGSLPFDAPDGNDFLVKQAHISQEPPKPTKLNPNLNRQVEAVVLKALAKSPKNRWPNCEAMAKALEEAYAAKWPVRRTRPDGAKTPPPQRVEEEPSTIKPVEPVTPPPQVSWFATHRKQVAVAGAGLTIAGALALAIPRLSPVPRVVPPPVIRPVEIPRQNRTPPVRESRDRASEGAREEPVEKEPKAADLHPVQRNEPKAVLKPERKTEIRPKVPAKEPEPSGTDTIAQRETPLPVQVTELQTPLPRTTIVGDPGATYIERVPAPRKEPVEIPPPTTHDTTPQIVPQVRPPERNIPPAGSFNWSLDLRKGVVATVRSRMASVGEVSGEALPGVPVLITIIPAGVAGVVEGPGPSNGWKTLTVRGLVNSRVVLSVQWKRL